MSMRADNLIKHMGVFLPIAFIPELPTQRLLNYYKSKRKKFLKWPTDDEGNNEWYHYSEESMPEAVRDERDFYNTTELYLKDVKAILDTRENIK